MTGTSLDGLDAALVRIDGSGLDMRATLLDVESRELGGDLRSTLLRLAGGESAAAADYLRAARRLGELHADVCGKLLAASGAVPAAGVDFIVAHGQTICHAPRDPAGPLSWQLFDPWPIVRRLGVPVCHDLRQADLIAGGEGAPITPLADWVMYRGNHLILNLGGVCNATWLRSETEPIQTRGYDLGPCNLVLDELARHLLPGERFDPDGRYAAAGTTRRRVEKAVGRALVVDPGRTHGRETLRPNWMRDVLDAEPAASPHDILASAVEQIVSLISVFVIGIEDADMRIVLAGGGTRNRRLVERLRTYLSVHGSVLLSDDLGIPCQAREAMAFAVLGALSADGVPITLPQVTGAEEPGVAGTWAGLRVSSQPGPEAT